MVCAPIMLARPDTTIFALSPCSSAIRGPGRSSAGSTGGPNSGSSMLLGSFCPRIGAAQGSAVGCWRWQKKRAGESAIRRLSFIAFVNDLRMGFRAAAPVSVPCPPGFETEVLNVMAFSTGNGGGCLQALGFAPEVAVIAQTDRVRAETTVGDTARWRAAR